MPRMTSVLVTALSAIGVAIGGLLAIGGGQTIPVAAKPAAQQDDINGQLYMSAQRDGEPMRNFGSAVSSLFAVVDYKQAVGGEQFIVQLRDLSGVVIKKQSLAPLTAGSGKRSVAISASDFIDSYRAAISVTQLALTESMAAAVTKCQNFPPPPDSWPIQLPTPQPGQPTPTAGPPHPYQRWLPTILDPLDASTLTTSELSRTLQAVLGMPDLANGRPGAAAAPAFRAAQADLSIALERLQQVPSLLQPPQVPEGPAIKPDPARGCLLVSEAAVSLATARTKSATAVAALPTDTNGWTLPRTIASYKGDRLQACVQYNTDLYDVVGGQQRSTPADTVLWTVGDPGAPAIIFPSPEQTDRGNAGNLRLTFPNGASAVFAKSVKVPGVNHEARVSAYITDRNCLPIAGTKVAFAVDPSGYGSLNAAEVLPDEGVAEVVYTAGDDVPADERGRGQISVRADAGDIEAKTQFGIVGPAEFLRIIVNPKVIHRVVDKRGGVTVELKDKNGNSVADGTAVTLRLIPPSVGQLAYERRVPNQREPEVVNAGTSIDLITQSGRTIVPPSQSNLAGVFIMADGRDGEVIIEVEADGKKANSNTKDEVTGKVQATVFIVSTGRIFMPVAVKKNNGFPPATPIVTRTPRVPFVQATPAP